MGAPTIKINKLLWSKVKACAKAGGYSSADEFVEHVLEKELASFQEVESDEQIIRKMKGLGYLD